jgi:polyisoprenoid-binding protein YceI
MKKILQVVGGLALLGWTGLGLFAWAMTKEQVHVTVSRDPPATGPDPVLLLGDHVGAIERDLGSLNETLGRNFSILDERVSKALADRGETPGTEPVERELRARIAALEARLAALEEIAPAAPGQGGAPRPLPTVQAVAEPPAAAAGLERAPEAPPPAVPPAEPAASFLAFKLPSQSFELDRRRQWTIVGSLSRVGFDGKSSLHDFTGATTAVKGELVVNPARPAERPTGKVEVDARTLDTGLPDRDEDMHERLASEEFPTFEFELKAFEPTGGSAEGGASRGTVRGRMKIRGVEHDFALPVKFEVDDGHRLVIEGSAPLLLSDYGVPLPNKLGLVKMEDEVDLWVTLRARPGAEVE